MKDCSMIGCNEEGFNSLSMAPGTYVLLCQEHYVTEMNNMEVKDTIECLLMEWKDWGNTYGELLEDVSLFKSLMERTTSILK